MTSNWRRCDVVTSHRRRYDVMCLLRIWPPLPPPAKYSNPWPPQYSKPSYAYGLNHRHNTGKHMKSSAMNCRCQHSLWTRNQADVMKICPRRFTILLVMSNYTSVQLQLYWANPKFRQIFVGNQTSHKII